MKKTLALIMALALPATMLVLPAAADTDKPFAGTKLTYWVKFDEKATGAIQNLNESKWYQAIYDATGIEIEFLHPAAGNEAQELSLLTAVPDELPDIIETNWTAYAGGPSAAIEDGIIITLDEYIAGGKTPNLKAILDAQPIIDKSIKSADGEYYVFPFLRGTPMRAT